MAQKQQQHTLPPQVPAMTYTEKGGLATLQTYEPKPMAKHDADLVVTYNGICGSDKMMVDNLLGLTTYPLVPGHEVVGHVIAVGTEVKDLAVGDVVGLGAQCQQCHECEQCKLGYNNLCDKIKFTYIHPTEDETGTHRHYGGFGAYVRTDARLLFKVPPQLDEAVVGPLMCGGLTVFAPLMERFPSFDATGKTVGVIGLGGLGHLAVQYAAKFGAKTVAISRNADKREYAAKLGATGYIDVSNDEEFARNAKSIDFLMVCLTSTEFDAQKYLTLLRPYGTLHFVGGSTEPIKVSVHALNMGRLSISGSPIGNKAQMQAMLEYSAKHQVKPEIEVFPHSKANEAMAKVRDGSIRFRAVLKNDLI